MNCIICNSKNEVWWHDKLGDRCTKCEEVSFKIWGFGEWCEEWRTKFFNIEQQKYLILHKRNIDFDVDFKTGKIKLK